MRIALALLTVAVAAFPSSLAAQDNGSDGVDMKAVAAEIEIMRRVLVKSLYQAGAGLHRSRVGAWLGRSERALDVAYLNSLFLKQGGGRLSHSPYDSYAPYDRSLLNARGFYVPELGALYTLDLYIPLKEITEEVKETAGDLWDEARKEMEEGEPASLLARLKNRKSKVKRRRIFDPEAIEKAVDTIVKALGRHAGKMEHLLGRESIVVCLDLRRSWAATGWLPLRKRSRTRLVLRASKQDLLAYGERRASLNDLKETVKLTRY